MTLTEEIDTLRKEILKIKREFSLKLDKVNDNLTKINDKYKDIDEDDVKREIRRLREEMDNLKGKKSWIKERIDGVVDKIAKLE